LKDINVIQYGMGFIGQNAVRMMLRKGFKLVGPIDSNQDFLGRDAGEITNLGRNVGVKVTNDIGKMIKSIRQT